MITHDQRRIIQKWADTNEDNSDIAAAYNAALAAAGQLAIMRAPEEVIDGSEWVLSFFEQEIHDHYLPTRDE